MGSRRISRCNRRAREMKIVITLDRFDGESRNDITSLSEDIDRVLKKYPNIVRSKEMTL